MSWVPLVYGTTGITAVVSSPPYSPSTITWGPATVFDPLSVRSIIDGFPYDNAINGSKCMVLTFGANLRGTDVGGAAIPCGSSCINTDPAWKSLHGRITTEFYIRSDVYTGPGHAGILCLASSANINSGSGAQAYALVYENISFSRRIRLLHIVNGFSGSLGGSFGTSYILLAQSEWFIFSTGVVYALSLEWEIDPIYFQGVRLRAIFTTDRTFEGPSLIDWHIVYTGAKAWVPSEPVGGGGGVFCVGSTSPVKAYFDNTKLLLPSSTAFSAINYPSRTQWIPGFPFVTRV